MANKIRSPKERDQELDKIWDELVRIQEQHNKLNEELINWASKLDLFHRQIMVQRSESDLEQVTQEAEQIIKKIAKETAQDEAIRLQVAGI